MSNVEKFIKRKKEFDNAEKYNVAMKLDYLISQVETLFKIINDELSITESTTEEIEEKIITEEVKEEIITEGATEEDNMIKETEILEEYNNTNEEFEEIIIDEDNEVDDEILNKLISDAELIDDDINYDEMTPESVMKEEFDAWGLSPDYLGCKLIIDMVNMAPNVSLTKDSEYDIIAKTVCPDDPSLFKRNITFIRKKADFSKSKYLTILSKIPAAELNNEFLLRNILELCY